MFTLARVKRPLRAVPLMLGLTLAESACDDTEEPQEPAVVTMRLTVGAQVIDVTEGTVTGGPIVINGNTNLSATFLKADGSVETLVTADEFELRVTPANTNLVTFTRTGAFAGTLNRVAAGGTQLEVALFHLIEQHEDFGPVDVAITVQ